MLNITIAICTYNGAARLPDVLEALRKQRHTETIAWDVLIVDNNSTDNTAAIVEHYAQNWSVSGEIFCVDSRANSSSDVGSDIDSDDIDPDQSSNFGTTPIRYCFEPRQGTTYARQRAFQEACGDWVGLLDDDNIPPPDWLAQAAHFIKHSTIERPQLGAFGGNIRPLLDTEPPPDFDRLAILLAVYDRGDRPFLYRRDIPNRLVPAAPGSFIRRRAWFEAVPGDRLRLGGRDERGGTFVGACEDLEALFYLQNSTWEIWHAPPLYVSHCLPAYRCTRSYLVKIARTSGLSNHALRLARLGCDRHLEMLWRGWLYFVSDGFKLLHCLWRTRSQGDRWVVACDRAAHLGRWLSPLMYGCWFHR